MRNNCNWNVLHSPAFLLLCYTFILIGHTSTAQVKIMCLGNSITQADDNHASYRYNLWEKLIRAGIDFEFVGSHTTNHNGKSPKLGTALNGKTFDNRNEGHWGWRADEILNGRSGESSKGKLSIWLQSYTPDIVLMHLGTNDILQCSGSNCIETTRNELIQIINLLRTSNPNVSILLAKVIPANRSSPVPENLIALNNSIQTIAVEYTSPISKITVIDQHTGFNAASDTYDTIHPDADGEEKMAALWFTAIESEVEVLPVTLTNFAATPDNGSIKLSWQTVHEKDNDYFGIERATDNLHFIPIGKVNGAGNTNTRKLYTFTDSHAPQGNLYYRLKQVDYSGEATYSAVIAIQKNFTTTEKLTLFPTRTSGEPVTIALAKTAADAPVKVEIISSSGKVVKAFSASTDVNGIMLRQIDIDQSQPAGVYLIKASIKDNFFFSRLIINR